MQIEGETRSCINILDEVYGSTEYLEPGCEITSEEELMFLEAFPDLIRDSGVVTISGSIPRGMRGNIYSILVQCAKQQGKRVILDTSGVLLKVGILLHPTMIKPNQDELEMLLDKKITNREEVIAASQKLHESGIPWVVISLGGDGALLVCKEGVYHGRPPRVKAVNTVGCGDSMVGAFAVAMEREYAPKESLRYAVAVATAIALSKGTGAFDKEVFREIQADVSVEELQIF